MNVYIEYVIIDNLVIDCLLLTATQKTLKLKINRLLLFLSAVLGTAAACVLPLFNLSNGFMYVIKIFVALLMNLLACQYKNIKEFIRSFYLFLFYTFLFGGAAMAVFYFLGIDFSAVEFTYNAEFSLGIILLIATLVYMGVYKTVSFIYRKRDVYPFVRKCVMYINGEAITLNGFIDSGNRLFCHKTGFPIILCSPSLGKKLLSRGTFLGVKSEFMSFYTVSGKSVIKIYDLDKLEIYNGTDVNTIFNVKIGLAQEDFKVEGEYDLILNPALV